MDSKAQDASRTEPFTSDRLYVPRTDGSDPDVLAATQRMTPNTMARLYGSIPPMIEAPLLDPEPSVVPDLAPVRRRSWTPRLVAVGIGLVCGATCAAVTVALFAAL